MNIAIIEDDFSIAEMYRIKCELEGMTVRLAGNGKEGLFMLKTYSPDIILLDIMMPEMTGTEFLEILRKEPEFANTPVIILTNSGTGDTRRSLAGAHVSDFIVKADCTPTEVIERIKSVFLASKATGTA